MSQGSKFHNLLYFDLGDKDFTKSRDFFREFAIATFAINKKIMIDITFEDGSVDWVPTEDFHLFRGW